MTNKLSIYLEEIDQEVKVTVLEDEGSEGHWIVRLGGRYLGTIAYRSNCTHVWQIIDVDAEVGDEMTHPFGFDLFEEAVRQVLSLWVESKLGRS